MLLERYSDFIIAIHFESGQVSVGSRSITALMLLKNYTNVINIAIVLQSTLVSAQFHAVAMLFECKLIFKNDNCIIQRIATEGGIITWILVPVLQNSGAGHQLHGAWAHTGVLRLR